MSKIMPYYTEYIEDRISIPPGNPGLTDLTNSVIVDDSSISQMKYHLDSPQNNPLSSPTAKPPKTSLKKIYCILIFMAVIICLAFATGGYFGYKINEDLMNKYDDLLPKINTMNNTILSNKEDNKKVDEKLSLSIERVNEDVEEYHNNSEVESESMRITNPIKSGEAGIELTSIVSTSLSHKGKVQIKWAALHMTNPECILNGTSLESERVNMEGNIEIRDLSSNSAYTYELTCTDEDSESVSETTSGVIPILVGTCQELEDIGLDSTTAARHYGLLDDIDCSATSGNLFTPIGSVTGGRFAGSINGFNHSIKDLTLGYSVNYVGLIAFCYGCSVLNLKLDNLDIMGLGLTGSVAGKVVGGAVIMNVHVQGVLSATGSNVGGLVGSVGGNCYIAYSSVNMIITTTGGDHKGGLIGFTKSATIIESFTKGDFSNTGIKAGGMIGKVEQSFYILDSYSGMNLLGNNWGGIVGKNAGDDSNQILNTYQTGNLNGAASKIILKLGYCDARNVYWDIVGTTQSSSNYGTGLDATQMKQKKSFVGFDFANVWYIDEGIDYPKLRWK